MRTLERVNAEAFVILCEPSVLQGGFEGKSPWNIVPCDDTERLSTTRQLARNFHGNIGFTDIPHKAFNTGSNE